MRIPWWDDPSGWRGFTNGQLVKAMTWTVAASPIGLTLLIWEKWNERNRRSG